MKSNIGFIGAGNMASALVSGLINSGHDPKNLMASSPEPEHLENMRDSFEILTSNDNIDIFDSCDTVVLAVKPHNISDVLRSISQVVSKERHLLISIVAGVLIKDIEANLTNEQRIIRAMPNTPASIKLAVSALSFNSEVSPNDKKIAENLFNSVGTTCWLKESSLDLYTALIGSGPAYIFYLIESLLESSKELELDQNTTKNLIAEMIIGSAQLAKLSADSPTILRQKVTSPAGVTQKALEVFEKEGIKESIMLAIKEAKKRSEELGN
ncbi:MAG: pyrroline-5-carboxylate reductase [SAR86 cluster bacterium]|jgi:pyrroline-5-carboxylate reductase|nr:pyrroline-5-carboxylate reductase [SAR86 cluster bacterium]